LSHRAISLAFGTWRTHFLAALNIVHATWLSSGRGHHPGWLASALCRMGQSPLPCPVALAAPCMRTTCVPWPLPRCCPPACSASPLLASPTDAWRPDRRPCSASTLPCPAVAVVGRGPVSTSPAAALGTAPLTPLAVCALQDCLLHGLLGVASAVSLPGAIHRRAMPSLIVCCSGHADGCQEHALGFPMARHGGTWR